MIEPGREAHVERMEEQACDHEQLASGQVPTDTVVRTERERYERRGVLPFVRC